MGESSFKSMLHKKRTISIIALFLLIAVSLAIFNVIPMEEMFSSGKNSPFNHRVPLIVSERSGAERKDVIISNGIPLPMGQVFDPADLKLEDESGKRIVAGFSPLQKWQDGSWRFSIVNFLTDLPANGQANYYLTAGDGKKQSTPLVVEDKEDTFIIKTGPLKFIVNKKRFNGIDQAWIDESEKGIFKDEAQIITSHEQGLVAKIDDVTYSSFNGQVFSAEIERQDSVSVTLKITGKLGNGNDSKLNYRVWIRAWAGSREVEVTCNLSKNEGEKWGDYYNINAISFNLPIKRSEDILFTFGGKDKNYMGKTKGMASIYQGGSDEYRVLNGNAIIDSVQSGKSDNTLNTGWADIASGEKGIGVAYKWFWQNFPSAITIDETGVLSTQIWAEAHQPLKLYTGVGKTTEMRFYFHGGEEAIDDIGNRLKAFQLTTIAQAPTSWYCQDTKAIDSRLIDLDLSSYLQKDHMLINMYMTNFEEGYKKLLKNRESNRYYAIGEDGYGFMNFGDGLTPSGGYSSFDTANNPSPEFTWWANNYYDHPHCFMLQFFRTGELKYLDYALEHVYHLMDIDTASYDPQFNFPGDYKTGPGVMHIKDYTAEYYNEKGQRDWRFGGQPGHWHFQSVESLFETYYMMGISQALLTGIEAADFAVNIATLNFTSETRSLGHTLEGLAAAYRHTWDEKYLERMNYVWNNISIHATTDYTGVNPSFPYKSDYSPYIYVQNSPWQNAIAISGLYKYRRFSPYVMGDKGLDVIARNTLEWDIWGRKSPDGSSNTGWLEEEQRWSGGADIMTTAGAWLDPLFPENGFLEILKQGMFSNIGSNFHLEHLKAFSHTFKYQWLTHFEMAIEDVKEKLYPDFTAFPRKIKVGEIVTFNNQSINAVSCDWSFGDGKALSSCDVNVIHEYEKPGLYDVELVVTDKDGNKEKLKIRDYIVVEK